MMDYSQFKVGEELVIVNNPYSPKENGVLVIVDTIDKDGYRLLAKHSDGLLGTYSRTTFRKITKLEKVMK